MKKSFITLSILLFLTACNSNSTSPESNGRIKILSTTAMIDDLVKEVVSGRMRHDVLIRGEMDPHSYELIKGDDEKFNSAHLIFSNGLGLEHGASLSYQLDHHPHTVFLGNRLKEKSPEKILSKNGQVDPHIWMDVGFWSESVDLIVEEVSKIDPENALYYAENGTRLKEKMASTHQEMREILHKVAPEKRFLVTSHDAFHYFSRAYLAQEDEPEEAWGIRVAAPEGLSPEGQLGSSDIQLIVDYIRAHQIGVVFAESNLNRDSLRKITDVLSKWAISIKIASRVLYGDAMGPVGSDADTYLKMMLHNAEVLSHEWQSE